MLLSSEDGPVCEEDPVVADVLEALISRHTMPEIEGSLASSRSAAQVREVLGKLAARGLLRYGPERPPAEAAFWDSVGWSPPAASVAYKSLCTSTHNEIQLTLQSCGIVLDDSSRFLVVTTDDYLHPQLAEISLRQKPWLLAKPVGHTIFTGPLFVPGQTACWSCMALWMKAQRWQSASFYGWTEQDFPPQPSVASLPSTIGIAANLIATAVSLWAARGEHDELEGAILSFDTRTFRQHRTVIRLHPECKKCNSSSKISIPKELHSFVSPLASVVSAVQITDKPVCGFFHALTYFAPPLPKPGINRLLRTQHGVGKGLTSHEAETCGIAEALERYSLIFRGDEPRIRASMHQLDNAVSPEKILLFSAAQFADRDLWNRTHSEIQWVPEPFDPNEEIDWTEMHSLATGETKFVPSALCFMHYDFRGQRQFCAADSNGCAAGPSLEEATLSALLELIERDAVAIWWYNRLSLLALDLAALGDAKLLQMEEAFRAQQRRLYVLDITSDIGIPACVAIAPKLDGSEPCFGAAADLSYRKAAFKAISEASQVCFWAATGSGSEELLTWLRHTSVQNHPYLQSHGNTATVPINRALLPPAALQECIRKLTTVGVEPFTVDLTRPEIGLPVVRVIAPGLRHFWGRLGSGRLYDVPGCHLTESELNPTPCMI